MRPRLRRGLLHTRIAAALAVIALLLRLLGARRTGKLLFDLAGRAPARRPFRGDPLPVARSLLRRIEVVARIMPGKPRCLTRSLLLAALLRRHRIPAKVQIGVDIAPGFAAHAWVVVDGTSLGEAGSGDLRYRPIWAVGKTGE